MGLGQYTRSFVVAVVALCILGIPTPQSATFSFEPSSEADWRSFMQLHTARESYRQFRFLHRGDDIEVHTQAHQIGELLFDEFGVEAMRVCDTSYSGGCLHGFLSAMLTERGTVSIKEVIAECKIGRDRDPYDNCEHGAGHALLFAHGYDQEGLSAALRECDEYFPETPTETLHQQQCYHGVFMEFNQMNTSHTNQLTTRTLDPDAPYDPCTMLAGPYKEACYYRLAPFWILASERRDDVALYQRSGAWCRAIDESAYRSSCYAGVQMSILEYSNVTDPTQTPAFCKAIFTHLDNVAECQNNMETLLVKQPQKHIF